MANPLPNPLNIQGEIRWLRGKSIEYEREPLRLRDLIKGKRDFFMLLLIVFENIVFFIGLLMILL